MDFRRSRPDAASLGWVEANVGARVVAWRRLTGGLGSAVHRLTVEDSAGRTFVVLRQYESDRAAHMVEREATTLEALAPSGLPAPRLLGAAPEGSATGGHPSLLMSRVAGHVHLDPVDPAEWIGQLAEAAAAIHDLDIEAPAFRPWLAPEDLTVPSTATDGALWRSAISALQSPGPSVPRTFIHRDFQHFNVLWSRGRLSGLIDWTLASHGPPEVDVGHCRLNLAVLFGPGWSEQFRLAYEAATGRRTDPWWDLQAISSYTDHWPRFIPTQVAGRRPVDVDGMTARVEELVRATLQRL